MALLYRRSWRWRSWCAGRRGWRHWWCLRRWRRGARHADVPIGVDLDGWCAIYGCWRSCWWHGGCGRKLIELVADDGLFLSGGRHCWAFVDVNAGLFSELAVQQLVDVDL